MKTFSDYILEKQNFIFGGKAGLTGKEFDVRKTLNELKPGDDLYHIIVKNEKHNYKISRIDHCTYASTLEGGRMSRLFVKEDGLSWAIDTSECEFPIGIASSHDDLYFMLTTYEPTEDEIAEAIERYSKIHESANFVFGGKSGLTGREHLKKYGNAPKEVMDFLKTQDIEKDWEPINNPYGIASLDESTTVADFADSVTKDGGHVYSWHDKDYDGVKFSEIENLKVYSCIDTDIKIAGKKCYGADLYLDGDNVVLIFAFE